MATLKVEVLTRVKTTAAREEERMQTGVDPQAPCSLASLTPTVKSSRLGA